MRAACRGSAMAAQYAALFRELRGASTLWRRRKKSGGRSDDQGRARSLANRAIAFSLNSRLEGRGTFLFIQFFPRENCPRFPCLTLGVHSNSARRAALCPRSRRALTNGWGAPMAAWVIARDPLDCDRDHKDGAADALL